MSTLKVNNIISQQGTGNVAVSFGTDDQVTFNKPISQSGAFMFRNKIINGNFDIWQRATSQTSDNIGSADRWSCFHAGSTKTASRQSFDLGQSDVPGNPKYFMRHVVTSVAGTSNFVNLVQKIEGVITLSGKTVTLSFWAKADANKNIAVEFRQNFGTGGSPSTAVIISPQLVALTTSWIKHTVTVDLPSIAGKTLGTDNNDYISVGFWFDADTALDNNTSGLGQQSGTFDIAQVQLEEGSAATPFEQRPIGLELSLCQRYYEKSHPQNIFPGQVAPAGFVFYFAATGASSGGYGCPWKVVKRVTPTVQVYSPRTGAVGKISSWTGSSNDINPSGINDINEFSVFIWGNGTNMYWNLTADAEI